MRKYFTLILICSRFIGKNYAQNSEIDSLKRLLHFAKDDTNKVKTLNEISWGNLSIGNYDSALMYANAALKLASCPEFDKGRGWLKGMAVANNTIGVTYFNKGFYPVALQHYFIALRIQEKLGDKKGIGAIYNGIGNIYGIQNQLDLALKNHMAALALRKEIGNKQGMANSLGNIGNVFYSKSEYSKALRYYLMCLDLMKELGNKQGIANAYGNIGIVYQEQKKYDKALQSQNASLKIHEEIEDKQGQEITFINIALIYTRQLKFKEAENFANKAIAISKEIEDLESMKDAYHALSEICEKTGRYKEAFMHFRSYVDTRDSLLNEENTKTTMRLEMNYEFDKREAAAKLEQEKKEAVSAAEARKQRIVLILVSCVLILVLVFAVFAYRSYLQKQKANRAIILQKDLIEEKQAEILASIHYAKRIQTALLTSGAYIARNLNRLKLQSNTSRPD